MFLGRYNHSLDAKGRVAIPARFRDLLGSDAVITRGIDRWPTRGRRFKLISRAGT